MSAKYITKLLFDGDISKGSYLYDLPVMKYLKKHKDLEFTADVTFFVGENGTGKSTLLEAVAVAAGFNAEGGSRNHRFSTRQTHSELYEHITLVRKSREKDGFFLRAESLYNVATNIDELDAIPSFSPPVIDGYGGVSLHSQSHGESFLSIVENRFLGNGLYLLDEPEAALSPMRLLTLMADIDALVKKGSQFIIATHSPMLMAMPNAQVLEFSQQGITSVSYKATEHYRITKMFLDEPERMLRYLLQE